MDTIPCTLYQDPNVTLPTEEDYRRCGCYACREVLRHLEHLEKSHRAEQENDALVRLLVAIALIARDGVDVNTSIGAELEAYRDACKKSC